MLIKMLAFSIYGYSGLILILIAFILNLIKKMDSDSYSYLLLNLIGGALLSYYSFKLNSIPLFLLQIIWAISAAIKLTLKIALKNRKIQSKT